MTKEGQFAKGWGTGTGSTKGGTESGWKLVKDDPDPRKRVWQLYQNGRPIKGKTKKQVQFSEMMVAGSALAMILLILISWIWKLVG